MFIAFGPAPGQDITKSSHEELLKIREKFFATKEKATVATAELHPSKLGVSEFLRTFDDELLKLDALIASKD